MRYIDVHDSRLPIPDDAAQPLCTRDLIYDCGDPAYNHDLHLNPEHDFTLADIEDLLVVVGRGFAEEDRDLTTSSGIREVVMEAEITGAALRAVGGEAEVERRIKVIERNLALNVATFLARNGYFRNVHNAIEDGGVKITTSLRVVEPGVSFVWVAKNWIKQKIKAIIGVSDQRKDETVALIDNC